MSLPMFSSMRRLALGAALVLPLEARAQDYRFPTTEDQYGNFYITAYYDHSGQDWNCGHETYSGHKGSDYGVGSWSGMYEGRDLVVAADGLVIGTNDGEFDECSTGDCEGGGGYGNYVWVRHADGKETLYAHMRKWTVAVSKGDYITCGTYIGQVGSSGYSTGPHVHFEVRESSGSQSDPFDGDCSYRPSYWVDQGEYEGLPSLDCDGPAEPCSLIATLTCGDVIDSSNDATGSTDSHSYYGCSEWSYSGPELAWGLLTDLDEPVIVDLTGLSDDLDIYILDSDACDGSDCLAYSDNSQTSEEQIYFEAAALREYVLVVDGWEDAISSFTLSITCEGGLPATDSGEHGDSGTPTPEDSDKQPDTSAALDSAPVPVPGQRVQLGETSGCGCGAGGKMPRTAVLGLLAVLLLPRRRVHGGGYQ